MAPPSGRMLPAEAASRRALRVALLGNPNTGKTTLFNRLCGIRARTANYPGITADARVGTVGGGAARRIEITDLPGTYGLSLDLPEARLCRGILTGELGEERRPDALLLVLDAANLGRNLVLGAEALALGLPAVIALNMIDVAHRQGIGIDASRLEKGLGCPVVTLNSRSGEGLGALLEALEHPAPCRAPPQNGGSAPALKQWADEQARRCVREESRAEDGGRTATDRLDALVTHRFLGPLIFLAVMAGLFTVIFSLATIPMELIEITFAWLGRFLSTHLPAGALRSLLVDGVVAGIAGTVVFLPQICLLFFLLSLLEDTGYLARAAFVADRWLRRFGLPGQAFVPLLSSHACAIPGILCTRLIPDRRERLASILVSPFLSCSARLPVYVLLVSLLFGERPLLAGLAFSGCYLLGAAAALLSALLARRTILRGASRPMVLELPTYRAPSLTSAALTSLDRGRIFLKKAGTVIVAICIILWWFSTYPLSEPGEEVTALRERAAALAPESPRQAAALVEEAARREGREALAASFAGSLGRLAEPLFRPIGCEWRLSVAILTSFAAREVFVSNLVVLLGAGGEELSEEGVIGAVRGARREDGAPLIGTAAAGALLVFYVLAMQCLPTLAVTRREAGGWRWALLQLVYMSALAYGAAFATYRGLLAAGVS